MNAGSWTRFLGFHEQRTCDVEAEQYIAFIVRVVGCGVQALLNDLASCVATMIWNTWPSVAIS